VAGTDRYLLCDPKEQHPVKPPCPRIFTGGIDMLNRSFLALAILVALGAACSAAPYSEEFRSRFVLAPGATLSLSNVTGTVAVEAWDEDYVDVQAVKKTSRFPADFRYVEIEIKKGRDSVIRTVYRKPSTSVSVDYKVRVPAGARLRRIENVTGDVLIEGAAECREAKTVTGSLTIRCAEGPLQAETVTGRILVDLGKLGGDAFYRTTTGSIEARLRPSLGVELDISVFTGGIIREGLQIATSESGGTMPQRLKGTIGKGGPRLRMDIVTGSIVLRAS